METQNTATTENKTAPVIAEVKKQLVTLEDIKKRPLSYSSLKWFKKSPLHFMHYRNAPKDKEESAALKFGNLLDCLLLTPEEFGSRYIILPETKTVKECETREEYDRLKNAYEKAINNTRKVAIKNEDLEKATLMRDIIWAHPMAKKLIERVTNVQCEKKWLDKETGLWTKTILDGESDDIIFELKTAKSADPEDFEKDAYNLGYHLQCGIELSALAKKGKFPQFWYMVIEKTAPYGLSIFQPSKDYIELGKKEYRHYVTSFKKCIDENRFDEGYEYRSSRIDKTFELDLPFWAKKKLELFI